MKLLYAFPEPLPLPRARGIQAIHTVAALADAGLSIRLAHVPGDDAPFRAYGLVQPQQVQMLPLSRGLPWLPVRSNKLFARRLARHIRHTPPDLIMVRHIKLAHWLLQTFPDIPLLYEAHEVFARTCPPERVAGVEAREGRILDRAAAIVSNSRATAMGLQRHYGIEREIHVIPNGVQLPGSLPEKPWHEAGRHIVYTGSLFGWKGADVLVEAAAQLPGLQICLYGGDREQVERLRARLPDRGARIELAGLVSHTKAADALAHACIAVLPNRPDPDSEWTSPIKLFEYMAAGCAIVASDLPPMREVLDEEDAAWAQPGNADSLARAIAGLAGDPRRARRMGERVREKAKTYSWSRRGEKLAAIMRKLHGTAPAT